MKFSTLNLDFKNESVHAVIGNSLYLF